MTLRLMTVLGSGKVGGAEAFFASLTIAFARAGLPLHAVLRPSPVHERQLAAAGVPFDTAGFNTLAAFFTRRRLAAIARRFAPDAVLTFAGRASSMMPPGPYALIGRLGGYYNLTNFSACDALVCNTPDLVRYCVDGGWDAARVHHIPNFPFIEEGPRVDRTSLGTPEEAPLALALGRLHPNKAMDVLIRAAARVPGLYVWIAGEGEERSRLESLARECGVAGRVRFLGWRTDRAGLFKAADLCVFPSRREPLGNVVLEAWAYGVPVIAAAATGPAWLIRDGEDGLLTPIDDAEAFAAAIRAVLADPAMVQRFIANGRRRIAAEFSEAAVVGRYVGLMGEFAARKRAA
jgi:glycosyltransferase involved in cell wall biosynthesis